MTTPARLHGWKLLQARGTRESSQALLRRLAECHRRVSLPNDALCGLHIALDPECLPPALAGSSRATVSP